VTREAAAAEAALVHQRVADELPPGQLRRETTLGVFDLQGELTFLPAQLARPPLLMLTPHGDGARHLLRETSRACCSSRHRGAAKELRSGLARLGPARIVRQLLTRARCSPPPGCSRSRRSAPAPSAGSGP